MMDSTKLAAQQLSRMRGMNRYYHERFFADIRFTTLAITALFVVGAWQVPIAYLLIPPLAMMGGSQTAFDASFLIFSRQYSTVLEKRLNEATGANVLVAHQMEDVYFFPLDEQKIVTFAPGTRFSWFGYMTLFYTALGVAAFCFGLALSWDTLSNVGGLWTFAYLAVLGILLFSSVIAGWWWFVGGAGERRLAEIVATVSLKSDD